MSEQMSSTEMTINLTRAIIAKLAYIIEHETGPIGYGKGGSERYSKWKERNQIDEWLGSAKDIDRELQHLATLLKGYYD